MQVTRYLGYSSLKDFFPTMDIKPNPGCSSKLCRSRQKDFLKKYSSAEAVAARQAAEQKAREEVQPASHEENEWKIETVPEDIPEADAGGAVLEPQKQALAEGLQFELPVSPADAINCVGDRIKHPFSVHNFVRKVKYSKLQTDSIGPQKERHLQLN